MDFNKIWQQQPVERVSLADILTKGKQFKQAAIRKIWLTNILLTAVSIGILCIWYFLESTMLSTKIGLMCIFLAIAAFLLSYNSLFTNLHKLDQAQSNSDYLANLNALLMKQKFMQTNVKKFYFGMLSTGIFLYMVQFTLKMSLPAACICYATVILWIAFNWFYIGPRKIKQEERSLNELIDRFKKMEEQLRKE